METGKKLGVRTVRAMSASRSTPRRRISHQPTAAAIIAFRRDFEEASFENESERALLIFTHKYIFKHSTFHHIARDTSRQRLGLCAFCLSKTTP